jgi:hypothetical protein
VFLTIFGEFGDSGEKKLMKSETHRDKFEKNQVRFFLPDKLIIVNFRFYI